MQRTLNRQNGIKYVLMKTVADLNFMFDISNRGSAFSTLQNACKIYWPLCNAKCVHSVLSTAIIDLSLRHFVRKLCNFCLPFANRVTYYTYMYM